MPGKNNYNRIALILIIVALIFYVGNYLLHMGTVSLRTATAPIAISAVFLLSLYLLTKQKKGAKWVFLLLTLYLLIPLTAVISHIGTTPVYGILYLIGIASHIAALFLLYGKTSTKG